MGRLLLLLALCFIPTALSHAIPARRNGKPPMISDSQMTNALKTAVRNDKINCVLCSTIVQGVNQLLADQEEEEKIDEFLKKACVTIDLWQPYVCDAMIDSYADQLYFVLERVVFTPEELCGIFVDDCGTTVHPLKVLWNLTIPGGKPPVKAWPTVTAPKKTQRVLHLSDIHVDREYTIGAEADCKVISLNVPTTSLSPVYMKINVNAAEYGTKIKVPAGKWGAVYACDIPYRTFDAAMRHISQTHKDVDYIVITGDMEAHDQWAYTKEKTQANLANVTQVLNNYFPNTPIYESVGNHEGVPMDAMAPHNMEEYDTRGPTWLYNSLADNWKKWITRESVKGVQYRASYVERPSPGLKLISINSVYCSVWNFYIYLNQTDPDGTLTWLVDELLDSEKRGEKVHIISHIPAGDDYCLKGWAHNFYEIVNRFENTIAAQFYGHTHWDQFQVYYEESNPAGRPTHFNFITPSITTYWYSNPAYRIYTIDGGYEGASYTVLDAETYTTDLDEANAKDQEPKWFLEYTTKDAYGLPDLSPASWAALIDRLVADDELFKKYHWYFYRSSYEDNCVNDPVCRQSYICYLRAAKSFEEDHFCAGFST
ncbi:hypothetical protein PENTCL1PPCAC_5463, partial [Pristionchus entomophagus]